MKRFFVLRIMAIAVLSLSVSCCNSSKNIFDCPVDMAAPVETDALTGHPVTFNEQPAMQIINLHTVDSFLVVKANVKESAKQMFVFNLRDKEYAGSFITRGRGAGELLKPICSGTCRCQSDYSFLYIFDLSLCEAYAFDIEASMETGKTEMNRICGLPDGTLYAYPFRDSMHFVKRPEPDGMTGMILNPDGSTAKELPMYSGLPGLTYFDKLSSADVFFRNTSIFIMAMSMLPQVNFIDIETGEKHTTAVNRQYRDWEQIFSEDMTAQSIYYTAVIPASNLVIALYYGVPLSDWATGNALPHLHVFNTEGELLYDLRLAESLKAIAYDEYSGILYGADMEDRLFQYDMSGIL